MTDRPAFRLLLSGDSMITRRPALARDPATRGLRALIDDADLAFTNLEVLPNDFRGYGAAECGGTHLAAHSWVVDELIAMGFDLVSAATNHALDYSIEGLLATIEVLESRALPFAGIGRNLAEARMPVYVDHPAGTLALLSCCSTFVRGQEAAEQRPDLPGRPGLNPLRHDRVYDVTPSQLAVLREIAEALGLERQRLETIQLGFAFPPDSEDLFPFLGQTFRAAAQAAVTVSPNRRDLEAIVRWVREARDRADLVVVSVHAHEEGGDRERPAAFIPAFAHRVIEEGADVVVGHGPHLLRGLELYRGKPIFYSLGNFIAQNDLVNRVPADAYERYRVDPRATPGALFAARNANGTRGFAADPRYWQSVLPVCHFVERDLQAIELVPVTLGHGATVVHRGQPRLATGTEATDILERVAALSAPFGAELAIDGDRAMVRL